MTAQDTGDTAVTTLKRTPLYAEHLALGARLVPFSGWEMPVQYSSILEEHRAVRTHAGLFDVSHMGEFKVAHLTGNTKFHLNPQQRDELKNFTTAGGLLIVDACGGSGEFE